MSHLLGPCTLTVLPNPQDKQEALLLRLVGPQGPSATAPGSQVLSSGTKGAMGGARGRGVQEGALGR